MIISAKKSNVLLGSAWKLYYYLTQSCVKYIEIRVTKIFEAANISSTQDLLKN